MSSDLPSRAEFLSRKTASASPSSCQSLVSLYWKSSQLSFTQAFSLLPQSHRAESFLSLASTILLPHLKHTHCLSLLPSAGHTWLPRLLGWSPPVVPFRNNAITPSLQREILTRFLTSGHERGVGQQDSRQPNQVYWNKSKYIIHINSLPVFTKFHFFLFSFFPFSGHHFFI